MTTVLNQVPTYLIGHYFWTYVITSTRPLKVLWGMDHNNAPREDITRFGEKAVSAGKISSLQLNMLKRNEASHANTIEQLPFFIGSVLLATLAKVPNEKINRVCLIYTIMRVAFHAFYLGLQRGGIVYLRTLAWWSGNLTCLWLLWQCKDRLG